jgi:endonuclease YncB( thermonuclease family)
MSKLLYTTILSFVLLISFQLCAKAQNLPPEPTPANRTILTPPPPYLDPNVKMGTPSKIPWTVIIGKVSDVISGDTFILITEKNERKRIHLAGVNAPKPEQSLGNVSKEQLSNLILNKEVVVMANSKQKSLEDITGKVEIRDADRLYINLEMIKTGMARFKKPKEDVIDPWDEDAFKEAENKAKVIRVGLWRDAT